MRPLFPLSIILLLASCGINGIYLKERSDLNPQQFTATEIQHRLILIGDAGDPVEKLPIPNYEAIKSVIKEQPSKHLTIFLGDNVYPLGLPETTDPNYHDDAGVLDQQLTIAAETKSAAIMIPGNHDWAKGKDYGLAQVSRQSRYVNQHGYPNTRFLPLNGSGKPILLDTLGFQFIIIDSQFWLQSLDNGTSPKIFESQLNSLELNADLPLIIVAHHPLMTEGSHGGFFTWRQHLFPLTEFSDYAVLPLPLIGSIYPWVRSSGHTYQDISADAYQAYIRVLKRFIELNPVLVYAAGHEHALEVFDHNTYYSVVSGAGRETELADIRSNESMLFASEQAGFISVDIKINGSIYLNAWHSDSSGQANLVYSHRIK